MSRALITLNGSADRARACNWIAKAPAGTRVEFKRAKRTLDQNSRFWAMLSDISEQLVWHGQKLKTEDWRLVFLDGLNRELRIVPNLNGDGFIALGRSSSDLSKDEMSQLIDLISAFGAQHGVIFNDPTQPPDKTPLVPRQQEAVSA